MRHSTTTGAWSLRLRDDTRMSLPRTSRMAWAAAFRGAYDPVPQTLLCSHIPPGTVVLDIGAALGLWTVPLAKAAMAVGSQVWAFEPFPGNHRWLEGNIAQNGLGNVTFERCALGASAGNAFMLSDEGGAGNAHVEGYETGTMVPMRVLDDIVFPARVSAIKIDVEGYELQALAGGSGLIARDQPVIFGEFSTEWLRRRGENLDGFLSEMRSAGYVPFAVELEHERWWLAPSTSSLRELCAGTKAEELLLVPRERVAT